MTTQIPHQNKSRKYQFLPETNQFMQIAKAYALMRKKEIYTPIASIIVKDNAILGIGDLSWYHNDHGCLRKRSKQYQPNQDFSSCPGCDFTRHSERAALSDASAKKNEVAGADIYVWGIYWCCEPCWEAMLTAGIKTVFLCQDSEIYFNADNPNNIRKQYIEFISTI